MAMLTSLIFNQGAMKNRFNRLMFFLSFICDLKDPQIIFLIKTFFFKWNESGSLAYSAKA